MTLSKTDNILNLQQIPTCKRFLQVEKDYKTIHDTTQVSAEVAMTLTLSEYEKYNTACLERETSQKVEDFDKAVRLLRKKGETQRVETNEK